MRSLNALDDQRTQFGMNAAQAVEFAGINRTFVYDIVRGKSANPNVEKLDKLAHALKVERNWLLYGMGDVEGEPPNVENPDDVFVAISCVDVRRSMGGGAVVDVEPAPS